MEEELFEQLLYESEGATLDFKSGQYRFAKASDEERSELLKDIMAFANTPRRMDAFIFLAMGLKPSPLGEVFRFFAYLLCYWLWKTTEAVRIAVLT